MTTPTTRRRVRPTPSNRFDKDPMSNALSATSQSVELIRAGYRKQVSKPIEIAHLELNQKNERDELFGLTIAGFKKALEESEWDFELYRQLFNGATLTKGEKDRLASNVKRLKAALPIPKADEVIDDIFALGATVQSPSDLIEDIQWIENTDGQKIIYVGNHRTLMFLMKGWEIIHGQKVLLNDDDLDWAETRSFIGNNQHKELKPHQKVLALQRQLKLKGKTVNDFTLTELITFGLKSKTEAHRIKTILKEPRTDLFWRLFKEHEIPLDKAREICELPDATLAGLYEVGLEEGAAPEQDNGQNESALDGADSKPTKRTAKRTPLVALNGAKKDVPTLSKLMEVALRGLGPDLETTIRKTAREQYGFEQCQSKEQVQLLMNLIIEQLREPQSDK